MTEKLKEGLRLLLTCRLAAQSCSVDPKTWRNWHERGLVPPPVRIGSSIFWRAAELMKWTEEGCPNRDNWTYRN